ncbi:MAG: hypothetical protein U0524_03560 [Candidatus Saccharimonadales bacterium]
MSEKQIQFPEPNHEDSAELSRAEKKVKRILNRQLNKLLKLPKDQHHEWQLTEMRPPPVEPLSWESVRDGGPYPGELVVTKLEDPSTKQEVVVAAFESTAPEFAFGNPRFMHFGVITPRPEGDDRKGYDPVLKLGSGDMPDDLLPEYTVTPFYTPETFQEIVSIQAQQSPDA